jgi:hypothetical protein
VWSNGNTSAEVIELEAKLGAMLPAVWMDGETFFDDKLDRQSGIQTRQRENAKISRYHQQIEAALA